jgi:dynactin complex subunit
MHRRAQSSVIPGAQRSPESGTVSPSKLPPLSPGMRCEVQGTTGTIRFVGSGSFSTGKWVGIELDEPKGKNNGSVQGVSYFECKEQYGVFVRPSQVKLLNPNPPINQVINFYTSKDFYN